LAPRWHELSVCVPSPTAPPPRGAQGAAHGRCAEEPRSAVGVMPTMEAPNGSARSLSGEDEVLEAAVKVQQLAREAKLAADEQSATPEAVRTLIARTLHEATLLLDAARSSPTSSRTPRGVKTRPSVKEFTEILRQEAVETVQDAAQESFEYAERSLRQARSLIEDHFHIDEAFRMLGPVRQDPNVARDVHDWFNLVALVPVIWLNIINWKCSDIFALCKGDFLSLCGLTQGVNLPGLWHGEAFSLFWWTTLAYFIADLCWMVFLPSCVKSPDVIIKHHVATLLYIMIPYIRRQYGWLMGACMIVEVNTWFLIARRSFNKNGDKPFQTGVPPAKSIRLVVVSTCFYASWFAIRLVFYPFLCMVICFEYQAYSAQVGTWFNIIAITPAMQFIFICLNLKWTTDLVRSKCKGRGVSKGL